MLFFIIIFRWITNPGVPVELQILSLGALQILVHVDDNLISQGFFFHLFSYFILFYCFTPLLVST